MAIVQTTDVAPLGTQDLQRTGALSRWVSRHAAILILGVLLVILPAIASDFILVQVAGWAMILGIIALSLMFLAGYGGMVSLAQMTVAGVVRLHDHRVRREFASGDQPVLAVVGRGADRDRHRRRLRNADGRALVAHRRHLYDHDHARDRRGVLLSDPAELADLQRLCRFHHHPRAASPSASTGKHPVPLYYLILFFAALSYIVVVYISRTPFGLALQGVRDNPRRMEAIGYNVTAHRIAAYAFAALIASIGGILMVWLNNQISPGSNGIEATIDLLVIAVVGGLGHPIGAFVGAIIYVILRTFALDALVAVGLDGRRFQTLIGLGFLVIVLFSPDGVIGLWRRWVARARAL